MSGAQIFSTSTQTSGRLWDMPRRFPGLLPAGFPARFVVLAMQSLARSSRHGDGHLWMIAFGMSLLTNVGIFVSVGFAVLESAKFKTRMRPDPVPPVQTIATIFPEMIEVQKAGAATADTLPAPPPPVTLAGSRFARTSEDQIALRPDHPAFLGERNTRATSDRAPDPTAPPLPSQAGIRPHDDMHIETTQSDFQDGPLDSSQVASRTGDSAPAPPPEPAALPPIPAAPAMTAAADPPDEADEETPASPPPPREPLVDGPNPVEVPVPVVPAAKRVAESPPAPSRETAMAQPKSSESPKTIEYPKVTPPQKPGFKGNQHKTAIVGSIIRNGRSALDVEDSPLGRYQATISRAVELEWQRNCVRYRDFITPGFLTVRFFVEPSGKVRSINFVGDMKTGEVQRGFTYNSIRDVAIPPMPAGLRKEFAKEPLELTFRFYF